MNGTFQIKDEGILDNASILPYALETLDNGKILVTGYFGGWTLLTAHEVELLRGERIHESRVLYEKLRGAGVFINGENIDAIIGIYRGLNRSLFMAPSLHMINTTNTCNYRCTYCHAGVSQGKDFMTEEIAEKTVDFIFKTGGHWLTIEFQGGECLLNWKVVKLVVERAREINKTEKRDLRLCIVSNLSLMTEEKMDFLEKHDVGICSSLDGPQAIHDTNRKIAVGGGSFATTVEKIRFVQDYYKASKSGKKVDLLATITKKSIHDPKGIVDLYVGLGIKKIHLRPVQDLGDALKGWPGLRFTPEEFFGFWKEAMEHIIELNRNGTEIMERGAFNILCKLLRYRDPLYVDQMSPAGAGRAALLYNFDGSVFSSDEGRMIPEPIFRIGTVDEHPRDVLGREDNTNTWASTFIDLIAYNSPFRPWAGIHPLHVYETQHTLIPNLSKSFIFKVFRLQCRYLLEKISENGFEKELFLKWTDPSAV